MKKWVNIENKLIPLAFIILLIVFWQLIVEGGIVKKYTLPAPADIVTTLFEIMPVLIEHISVTLMEAAIGFLVAIGLAVVLAVLMDNVPVVKKAFYPLIIVSQTVPIIALAPLFAIWFGFGLLPKVIVVILVCFFPVAISLIHGLESVDQDLLNLLVSMGANKLQIFRLVKFPASMVHFFSGLRIAATYSIMGAIIGEWLGGSSGLGVYMLRAKHSYALDRMFAAILVIVVLSILVFLFIGLLERLLVPSKKIEHERQTIDF